MLELMTSASSIGPNLSQMQHFFQECNLFLAISANNFFNNRDAGYQKLAAHLAEDYKEYCSSIQAPYQIFYFPLSSISISSPISLIQSSIEAAYTIFHIPLSSILSVSNSREMSRETEIRISSLSHITFFTFSLILSMFEII